MKADETTDVRCSPKVCVKKPTPRIPPSRVARPHAAGDTPTRQRGLRARRVRVAIENLQVTRLAGLTELRTPFTTLNVTPQTMAMATKAISATLR
jgi:hypothetical protein